MNLSSARPFCRAKVELCFVALLFPFSGGLSAARLSPQEALNHMKVADGFEVKLVAHEPEIRQPLSITFDERGRMWVIQYLQYPTPAGLKPVSVDQYLRTKYDRVPDPPPRGPKGADRITICEDTDGDGRFDKFKDFVSGLNLASGMEIGYGGVFIVQPPYLLFYPDRDHDDIPDGDPEVLLSGFGLEDAHAVANSRGSAGGANGSADRGTSVRFPHRQPRATVRRSSRADGDDISAPPPWSAAASGGRSPAASAPPCRRPSPARRRTSMPRGIPCAALHSGRLPRR